MNGSNATFVTRFLALVLACVLGSSVAQAQSADEIRAKELQAKIKKDMAEIDALLLNAEKASPAATKEKLEEVKKNLDEMLKNVQSKQGQVMSDIEELIKLAKSRKNNGKSGQQGQQSDAPDSQQEQGGERQREQAPDELQRQQEQKEGQQSQGEQSESQQKPENGKDPKDGRADASKGEQEDGQAKPEGEKGKFERDDVRGRWGVLPPKVAEQLQQLGAGNYAERYRTLIERYYRAQAERESKKQR